MKRFFYFSLLVLLCAAPSLRAQEAEENNKILRAKIEDLSESRTALLKRIQALEKELSEVRAQVAKPPANFATPEDLKHLADTVREIDRKREEDKKLILKEIADLGKVVSHPVSRPREATRVEEPTPPTNQDQPTFTYTVKEGDYLSKIAKLYSEKGNKVSVDEILKANPGLKVNALIPGRTKILIPDNTHGNPLK